ncbi:MAG: outer membrane protein assembly factor BamD [Neisseriales bacterium]|nr:MAG: outer membrane protein assembly factor BamD [Neisseriales bacterium]
MKKITLLVLSILPIVYVSSTHASNERENKKQVAPIISAQTMYQIARTEFDRQHFHQSIKLYQALETQYPYSDYAKQAKMDKAYAYFRDNKPKEALSTIEQFIKLYPKHIDIDYMYYLEALVYCENHQPFLERWNKPKKVYQDSQSNMQALVHFERFIAQFPESQYVADAQQRILHIRQELSEHHLLIARYNMRRGAHIAAINRAQDVIKQYPDTPSVEEALAILVKSYAKLGHVELSKAARVQLRTTYPNSRWLK